MIVLFKIERKNRKVKKIETSKLLLKVLLSLVYIISASDIIAVHYTGTSDSTILVTLTECVYAMATIAVAFYYWKARCENLHKYKQDDKIGMD